MPGETTAGYLTALHMKGETLDEITASANGMRDHAESLPHDGIDVLEIVGTGGDCANSFNISTTSGIVAAALEYRSQSTATEAYRARVEQRMYLRLLV